MKTSLLSTLIAATLALSAPLALAAVPKDMLAIGKAADPQTLDPAITIDNNDWTVTYPSYQRLVKYKPGSTEVEGDLSTGWKASDDQKEWTFTLADNAKFSDGTPVTAEAVKLSFERLLKLGQGPSEAFPKDLKIDAVDDHTVKFTLSQPFAPFLYTLANDGASIINPAVLKANAADDARGFLAQNTAGSGPFMLKSWQKGQQLVLVPNPHFSGTKPTFKRVTVKIIGESAARRLQLTKGDLDIADALPVEAYDRVATSDKAEHERLMTAALTDARILPPNEAYWRAQPLAALQAFLKEAKPLAALKGTQTGGNPPAGGADLDTKDSNAIAQAAPGPNMLFVAIFGWTIGLNAGGVPWAILGLFLTLVGVLLPSTMLTYFAAQWGHRNRELRAVRAFKQGMAPIVIALLIASGWILASAHGDWRQDWPLWVLSATTVVLSPLSSTV